MFPRQYFGGSYFPPRYFPAGIGVAATLFGAIGVTAVLSNASDNAVVSTLDHQVVSIATARRVAASSINHGVTSNARNRAVLGVAA